MNPSIDLETFAAMMARTGLSLTPAQVSEIYQGYGGLEAMLARVNVPLPREAEPALTFDPEGL